MESTRRDLESFGKGLTDEQIIEKKKMMKESAESHPEIAEYFRELAVDFCVRFPQEATKQRETREWESQKSAFFTENYRKMSISSNNMTHIIHSRNLFIDTSTGSGKGDEFNLELGANQISAGDGQFLRLTLVSFNCYNNIYPINSTNNQFRVDKLSMYCRSSI